jgi:ParB family transcriptional regulator, chromosome partitioning protein
MNNPAATGGRVIGLQERRLGPTVLRTYRTKLDIDDVVPNERQPRLGPKEDDELQRQIEANEGLFEPLLVEPHPSINDKFRIIDGERRWANSKILVDHGREEGLRPSLPKTGNAYKKSMASSNTVGRNSLS